MVPGVVPNKENVAVGPGVLDRASAHGKYDRISALQP
jgi:hypothetical protein